MWSLISPRAKRISGPEEFRSSPLEDFCNNIRQYLLISHVRCESEGIFGKRQSALRGFTVFSLPSQFASACFNHYRQDNKIAECRSLARKIVARGSGGKIRPRPWCCSLAINRRTPRRLNICPSCFYTNPRLQARVLPARSEMVTTLIAQMSALLALTFSAFLAP